MSLRASGASEAIPLYASAENCAKDAPRNDMTVSK